MRVYLEYQTINIVFNVVSGYNSNFTPISYQEYSKLQMQHKIESQVTIE